MGAPHILHIEDNKPQREIVKEILLSLGYDVASEEDFAAGLRSAREKRPDLILLDIMMPGVNGIAACGRFKADPELKDVPILMLTALGQPKDVDQALAAGAADYLTKPVSIEALKAKLSKHLPGGG